jgi:predicted ATPase
LAERELDAMIDGVVSNKRLPASIRQDIIERSDGIPLFVEEMTKAAPRSGRNELWPSLTSPIGRRRAN